MIAPPQARLVSRNVSSKWVCNVLLTYKGMTPKIGKKVFLAPGSHVIGQVEIGDNSSVWFNCVLRGDSSEIIIGTSTNIQDGTVIHGAQLPTCTPVIIGDKVVIGHNAVIHACTIGNGTLIGMGAVILNRAIIGEGCLIGAGSVVVEDMVIPPGMLAIGNPARVIRELSPEQHSTLAIVATKYCEEGVIYTELLREAGVKAGVI